MSTFSALYEDIYTDTAGWEDALVSAYHTLSGVERELAAIAVNMLRGGAITVPGEVLLGAVLSPTVANHLNVIGVESGNPFVLPEPTLGLRLTFVALADIDPSATVDYGSGNTLVWTSISSDGAASIKAATSTAAVGFVGGQAVAGDAVEFVADGSRWYALYTGADHAGFDET